MNKRLQLRKNILGKYDSHCSYCGKDLTLKNMQIDHQVPKAYNWRMVSLFNEVISYCEQYENLFPACRRCNHYKRDDNLEQFRGKIKTLHERLMGIYIIKVAIDFGIVKIEPFDGKFYFEKLKEEK
jgi:5-methylcytosine-specific restriction endonuclease McrA